MNFKYISLLTVLILSITGCAAPIKTSPDPGEKVAYFPSMNEGDTWVVTDRHSKHGSATYTYKVSSVESDGSFDLREENDKGDQVLFHHFDSTQVGVPLIAVSHFDNNALQFPIFVGKAWFTEDTATSVSGKRLNYKSKYYVKEYSDIETSQGQVKAFWIRQTVKSSSGWAGHYDIWYAPTVKAVVKTKPTHIRGSKLISTDLIE